MKNIAILGFGKVGQSLLNKVQTDPIFHQQFKIGALWNRQPKIFESFDIPNEIEIYERLPKLINKLDNFDLVVECAHPQIVKTYGTEFIKKTNVFVSSPTAFADKEFYQTFVNKKEKNAFQCFLPVGASVGMWDVIKLDQQNQIKNLHVSMKKHPDSFKIQSRKIQELLETSRNRIGTFILQKGRIDAINRIAPQNTNTMTLYALAATGLSFEHCQGSLIADRELSSHIIELRIETHGGLHLSFIRDNPAQHGQVTGSATFGSFFTSLLNHDQGIRHGHFTFC